MKRDKVPQKLVAELIEITNRTKRRIDQKIQKKISDYDYTISRRIACFLVAKDYNVNFSKYLNEEDREKLRQVSSFARQIRDTSPKIVKKKTTKSLKPLKGMRSKEPFLPSKLLDKAREMAEKAYPFLYIFENSVRNVIKILMENKYGSNWWDRRVKQLHRSIDDEVQRRMNDEKQNRWHSSKRGIHKIYYTDLEDLRIIIEDNWTVFKKIHNRRSWIIEHIMQLKYSRNIIAHNNPLTRRDITSIQTKIHEWFDQIKD